MGDSGAALRHQLPGVQRSAECETGAKALGGRRHPAHVANVGRAVQQIVGFHIRSDLVHQHLISQQLHPLAPGCTAGAGNVEFGVAQIVAAQRLADFLGEAAFGVAVLGQTEITQVLIHRAFKTAVWHIVGAGLVEAHSHLGVSHQRCALGDVDHPLVNVLRLVELRCADQVQHLGVGLHHVGGAAAGVGDRIVQPRFLHNMFAQEVGAGIHQRHRVQRAAPQVRRVGGMGGDAFEVKRRLNVGQRTGVEHAAEAFRVPGEGGVDVVEQAFAHHKGFAGAPLFARAAVEAQGAGQPVLLHPRLGGEGARQRRGAQQIVAAAMAVAVFHQRLRRGATGPLAQPGQRVVLAQQRDNRVTVAVAGDKRRLDVAHAALDREAFLFQRIGQQRGGIGLVKARFRMVPNRVAQRAEAGLALVNVVVDKSLQF